MKKTIIFLSSFIPLLLSAEQTTDTTKNDLVVVLMVKNEAENITQTLVPFMEAGISSFFIYDTGSSDGTETIAREYFDMHNITTYKIISEPFVDFSTSRNKALRYTEQFFPNHTFMLMPDAEWYIYDTEKLVTFCKQELNNETEIYTVRLVTGSLEFYTPRLLRMHKNIQFHGKIHEAPISSIRSQNIPENIFFVYAPSKQGKNKSATRWERDLVILQEEYDNNPHDPRTVFYLAQTYDCLQNLEKAFEYYTKRAEMNGWDEENYIAWHYRGKTATALYRTTNDTDWLSRAMQSYEHAWNLRPSRIEAAVNLAELYINKNQMQLAYLILREIFEYPYPKNDLLFIEKDAYTFRRYELLSICAWYVNDYKIGKTATIRALLHNQELSYLQRNLALHILKLEEQKMNVKVSHQ
jgi:hypothetical protein